MVRSTKLMGGDFAATVKTVGDKLAAKGTSKKGIRQTVRELKDVSGSGNRPKKTVRRLAKAIVAQQKGTGKSIAEAAQDIKSAAEGNLTKDKPGFLKSRKGKTIKALKEEARAENKEKFGKAKLSKGQKATARQVGSTAFRAFKANQKR